MMSLRKFSDDTFGAVIITRLLAISIPVILVTMFHAADALGMSIPGYLLSPTIGLALVATGCIIAVFGMKVGLAIPFICILLIWVFGVYFHWQYEIDILCIPVRCVSSLLYGIV